MMRGVGRGRQGWWDWRDHAWRQARALYVLVLVVVALYLAGLLAFVVVLFATIVGGSAAWLGDRVGELAAWELAVGVAAVLVGAVVAVVLRGWWGLPRSTRRLSGSRQPNRADDLTRVRRCATAFALSYGLPAPRLWVIDDPAPNALAFGLRSSGNVSVTTGALELPRDELDALVMVGEWCTQAIWIAAAFVILALVVGFPIELAAAYVVGTGVLVLTTRPVLFFVERAINRLVDDTEELIDLETIRHSNEPASLARLLIHLAEDRRRVKSRCEVAHLWFARDVKELVDRRNPFRRWITSLGSDSLLAPPFSQRASQTARRDLLLRATTAIALAEPDDELRERLERANHAQQRSMTHE